MSELSRLLQMRRMLDEPGGGEFLASALLQVRARTGECMP
jgi:hypothetical protein